MKKSLWPLVTLTLLSSASAKLVRIGQTDIYYKLNVDTMIDENSSRLDVFEVNDTEGNTSIRVQCRGQGKKDVYFVGKNTLLTLNDYNNDVFPGFMYRVDKQLAKTISSEGALIDDKPDLEDLAFSEKNAAEIISFLTTGNKIAVRIVRNGMTPLNYTFNAAGFVAGMKAINNCK